eukprot:263352_1
MDTKFLKKYRLALVCTVGAVMISGCFIIYQSSKNKDKNITNTANRLMKMSNTSETESIDEMEQKKEENMDKVRPLPPTFDISIKLNQKINEKRKSITVSTPNNAAIIYDYQ